MLHKISITSFLLIHAFTLIFFVNLWHKFAFLRIMFSTGDEFRITLLKDACPSLMFRTEYSILETGSVSALRLAYQKLRAVRGS
jgi:hypothetical protein